MWLDNASDIDILFYEPYARIIADIAKNEQYNPLTVGVFGLWGAGKSTLLKLIGEKLKSQDGICEERGSGYDKIVEATGKNELLAPRIENQNNQFTKAILFAKVPFELTTKEDRMRTCYMQACLAYVNFEGISNSDIRKIFGLGEKEKAKASRLLTSAVEGGYIKVMDPDTAPRYKKYIPYWA